MDEPNSSYKSGRPVSEMVDIADTETLTATTLGQALTEGGAFVRYYYTGPEEVISAIKNIPSPPCLLIMEVYMQTRGDGIAVLEEVSRHAPHTARLMVTRETDPVVLQQAQQAGADRIMYKQNCRIPDILKAAESLVPYKGKAPDRKKNIPISRALYVLETHQDKIATVNEWADFMGYKKSTFWRLYTSHYKTAPRDTLNQVKKERLWKLLQTNPGITAQELAEKLGYANSEYIYQVARVLFGASFGELRKRVEGNTDNETNP